MKILTKKYLLHILIITLSIAFFFAAPLVEQKIALRQSGMGVFKSQLPEETTDARLLVDTLRIKQLKNQIYEIRGWGFMILDSKLGPDDYQRSILLISDTNTFEMPVINEAKDTVLEVYKDLDLPILNAGYKCDFSKIALPKGLYTVAMLFTLPDNQQFWFDSNAKILKTHNTIELIKDEK